MAGQLLPGENLILKLHQHWIFVAKSLLIPIALLLLVVVADIVLGSTSATNIRLPLTLAIVAIALLWLIVVVLVVAGIIAIFRAQILWGIVLIVVGLLVGPGGVSVFG